MAVALGDVDLQTFVLDQLAGRAILAGDDRRAVAVIVRRLGLVRGSSAWYGAGFSVMQMALILAARHDHRLAARTHGSLIALLPILRSAVPRSAVTRYDTTIASVRAALGDALFEDETRIGSLMSLPQIVREVLPRPKAPDEHLPTVSAGSQPNPSPSLTAREAEVVALLADGLSNKEIAHVLEVSPKTVMHHPAAIYRKFGVRGRSEVAVAALKQGLIEL